MPKPYGDRNLNTTDMCIQKKNFFLVRGCGLSTPHRGGGTS